MAQITALGILFITGPKRTFTAKEESIVWIVASSRRVFTFDILRRALTKDTKVRALTKDTKVRILNL